MKKFNILILFQIVLFIGLKSQISLLHQDFEELRPLSEFNDPNKGDGYPWISEDGLRLYFNANDKTDNRSKIFVAHRQSDSHGFTGARQLSVNTAGYDNLSPTLSADELTLAFVLKRPNGRLKTELFISFRNSIEDAFGTPESIKLYGDFAGTLISPSFTPDFSELYIFNELNGETTCLIFQKSGSLEYNLKSRLQVPRSYKIKSGKMSEDGLSYYLSLSPKDDLPRIYIMTREDVNEDFGPPQLLESSLINDSAIRNHQPYFTNNRKYLVFTRSSDNAWMNNDIFIAKITPQTEQIQDQAFSDEDFNVFPNPTHNILKVENKNDNAYNIYLFDMTGKMVMRYGEAHNQAKMDLGRMEAGQYILVTEDIATKKTLSFTIQKVNL